MASAPPSGLGDATGPDGSTDLGGSTNPDGSTDLGGSTNPDGSTDLGGSSAPDGEEIDRPQSSEEPTGTDPYPSPTVPTQAAPVSYFPVPSRANESAIERITDLEVLTSAPRAVLSGWKIAVPGGPTKATVWHVEDGKRTDEITLNNGDGDRSTASAVAHQRNRVAVVGSVNIDRQPRGVIWRSKDGGKTFGDPVLMPSEITDLTGVAFNADGVIVAGTSLTADGEQVPVVGRNTPDGRVFVALAGGDGRDTEEGQEDGGSGLGAHDMGALDISAFGATVLVSAQVEESGGVGGVLWVSPDDGATFTMVDDPFASYSSVGPITEVDDEFVASAASRGSEPMAILRSSDGIEWSAMPVSLSVAGQPVTPTGMVGGGSVLPYQDRYLTSASDGSGQLAAVSTDGEGDVTLVGPAAAYYMGLMWPFASGNGLNVVVETPRSFAVWAGDFPDLLETVPPASQGPLSTDVELFHAGSGPASLTTTAPHLTIPTIGTKSIGPESLWGVRSGDKFVAADASAVPNDTDLISTNRKRSLALQFAVDDSSDDPKMSYRGGMLAQSRIGEAEWSNPRFIAYGPGRQSLEDIAPLGSGFVAVGYSATQSVDEATNVAADALSGLVMEYVDDAWSTIDVDSIGGEVAYIDRVFTGSDPDGDDELAIAFGGTSLADPKLLVLTRSSDGEWRQTELQGSSFLAEEVTAAIGGGRFDVLVGDGSQHQIYSSTDGTTFEPVAVTFDNPHTAHPNSIVSFDGQRYIVGTSGRDNASRVAVWAVRDDGTAIEVPLAGSPGFGSVQVTSVLVRGTTLWLAGIHNERAVTWRISLGG